MAGKAVGQCPFDIFLLGSLQVLLLPTPGLQGRGLQGSAIGEGQGPWLQQGALVDCVEVDGCLLLTLTSRQEGDPCKTKGEMAGGIIVRDPGHWQEFLEADLEIRPMGIKIAGTISQRAI